MVMASQRYKVHRKIISATLKGIGVLWSTAFLVWAPCLCETPAQALPPPLPCLANGGIRISPQDTLLVAGPDGQIIYAKNETKRRVPASTLKILTALAAIHHLGTTYRFKTEFYLDPDQNLKVKGYGDPLLISEVWQEIAQGLPQGLQGFKNLMLDDSYFVRDIHIPGVSSSTNPYDAPVGALCANFNTVFFKRSDTGRIVSAEPQTPMTPLSLEKVRMLALNRGRYTFSHDRHDGARYAGEILAHFLREKGLVLEGEIRAGVVGPGDTLVYTYHSIFALEQVLSKMFEFSNNFIANQILIALGAHVHGPPGTLAKGVRVVSEYARQVLHLHDIEIAEGSGISRMNRMSALGMLAVLRRFEAHRTLLVRKGPVFYKTGTLMGVQTRAGYIEGKSGSQYYFVIFLNSSDTDIDSVFDCVKKSVDTPEVLQWIKERQ
jgi:D-alanyl-D-alanine carboxypeptidase/D-alanyl-D-alanine-endopeptidase (penicillin-binding protein 4)